MRIRAKDITSIPRQHLCQNLVRRFYRGRGVEERETEMESGSPPCGTVGPFGRVSPSLMLAEQQERATTRTPSSFKRALDSALDTLDEQAEKGQLSSGAYTQLAKKMKEVYDAQGGTKDDIVRETVMQMALLDPHVLVSCPDEVEFFSDSFLKDLLWKLSDKLHSARNEETENDTHTWLKTLFEVYTVDCECPQAFWGGFANFSMVLPGIPPCIASRVLVAFGECLENVASSKEVRFLEHTVNFDDEEAYQDHMKNFWEDVYHMFPSDHTITFIERLFKAAKRNEPKPVTKFRAKLLKELKAKCATRCQCDHCTRLYSSSSSK